MASLLLAVACVLAATRICGARVRRVGQPPLLGELTLVREEIMATGVGVGVAIPHAQVPGLAAPVAALGLAEPAVDFGAPDGSRRAWWCWS
ncbi:MAG TPA: hypothetical protein VMR50_15555 [Myxococcota bacterium]|nr:hypothetical protein [Myxococcota bacterium]